MKGMFMCVKQEFFKLFTNKSVIYIDKYVDMIYTGKWKCLYLKQKHVLLYIIEIIKPRKMFFISENFKTHLETKICRRKDEWI